MSVEMLSSAGEPGRQAARRHDRALRTVLGVLDDGTACYAPMGEVITDGTRVICHLCGPSLRSVTAHLRAHGWTKVAYCEAFGLERGQSLEGPETRKRRSAAFSARLIFDPAVREGSAAGRELLGSQDRTALADMGEPVRSAFTVTREDARDRTVPAPFMGWSVIEGADGEAAAWVLQDHPFISRGGVLRISEPV